MEHMKKKKRFSRRDILYKSLLFVATVTLIVYFLPRDGKFNYQFDINKPWKYGQLIATLTFRSIKTTVGTGNRIVCWLPSNLIICLTNK